MKSTTPSLMSQKDFLAALRKEMPELEKYGDIQLMNAVLKRRPDLTNKVANPMSGDANAAMAQKRAEARAKSLVDPEFWQSHPNTAGFTKSVLDTLPATGAMLGGLATGPETGGAGALLGMPGGAMLGRSGRDFISRNIGLENISPWQMNKNALSEGAITALTPGVATAVAHPVDTARMAVGDYSKLMPRNLRPWLEPQLLEDFANSVNKGPKRIPMVSNFANEVSASTPAIEGQVMPENFKFDPRGSYIEGEFADDLPVPTGKSGTRYGRSSPTPKLLSGKQ